VAADSTDVFAAAKLPSPVGMHDASGKVLASGDRVVERFDGDAGFHPCVAGIPDDLVGDGILNRAKVKLPVHRAMFGHVGQPQLVAGAGGEVAAHVVLVCRWSGSGVLAPVLSAEHREPVA